MATLWRQDGSRTDVQPADGHSFTLEEMRAYARTDGGPVELVWLSIPPGERGEALVIDDDGHAHGRGVNHTATALYRGAGGIGPIMGDALHARYEHLGTEQERWY